ncbi:MAG: hypothetical protein NC433_02965 [Clostridiales bacterium]|nr:hypothetical protein [Clostridiales bacterium]
MHSAWISLHPTTRGCGKNEGCGVQAGLLAGAWTASDLPTRCTQLMHTLINKAVMHIYTTLISAYGIHLIFLTHTLTVVIVFPFVLGGLCMLSAPE